MKRLSLLLVFTAVLLPETSFSVHESVPAASCMDCHGRIPFRNNDGGCQDNVGEICRRCHYDSHSNRDGLSHPLNISPKMPVPRDMPLDSAGRMNCATCHTFHKSATFSSENRPSFLRRASGQKFCLSCHRKIV